MEQFCGQTANLNHLVILISSDQTSNLQQVTRVYLLIFRDLQSDLDRPGHTWYPTLFCGL